MAAWVCPFFREGTAYLPPASMVLLSGAPELPGAPDLSGALVFSGAVPAGEMEEINPSEISISTRSSPSRAFVMRSCISSPLHTAMVPCSIVAAKIKE
jgi:hypothetical protein